MYLLAKTEFVGLEQVTHLAPGGEAPWLRSHDQATARMGALKSGGMAGREQLFAVYERAKSRVARMLGVDAARVAFLGHASEGLNQAVKAVPWRAGDNVVFADLEYPSSIYPAPAPRRPRLDAKPHREGRSLTARLIAFGASLLCGAEHRRDQVVGGDFNGDGRVDYAVLLRVGVPKPVGAEPLKSVSLWAVVFLGRRDGH